jgi:Flp pilus assembly protein CpaB
MGRARGLIWLVSGLLIALLAGLLSYMYLNRAAAAAPAQQGAQSPPTTVIVAARDVPVRTQLVAEDLRMVEMPTALTPPGAVTSLETAVGMLTTADLFEGETVLTDRLLDPTIVAPDGRLALMMVEDEVLMAIPALDIMSQIRVLKPADHVDILASLTFEVDLGGEDESVQTTFALLQNVTVAGLVGPNISVRPEGAAGVVEGAAEAIPAVPDALLLTLSPQDALSLKYTIDAGGTIDFVLRAPGVDRLFETDAVDVDYMDNRYDLPLEPGQ